MAELLAIDPGPEMSAWVLYDCESRHPISWAKEPNRDVLTLVTISPAGTLAVEWIASYGMAVGADVFETCVWVGRFIERWSCRPFSVEPLRVYRRDVKLHICGSMQAGDPNVRQAIIDRYGPGKARAVGLKATPGPLYGMKADVWQALGVAITAAETRTT